MGLILGGILVDVVLFGNIFGRSHDKNSSFFNSRFCDILGIICCVILGLIGGISGNNSYTYYVEVDSTYVSNSQKAYKSNTISDSDYNSRRW